MYGWIEVWSRESALIWLLLLLLVLVLECGVKLDDSRAYRYKGNRRLGLGVIRLCLSWGRMAQISPDKCWHSTVLRHSGN